MQPVPHVPALFLASLLCLIGLSPSTAWPSPTDDQLGPRRQPSEMGTGGLLLKRADGLRAAPTLETRVDIRISGMISRTTVVQRFTNPTTDWVEGIYVFPLPEKAAVDSLRMRVGERIIEGQIQERSRARATYHKARSEGRKAALVEQQRPNLFTSSVANLGPGEQVEITLTYQEDVRYDQGSFSLRFPMVAAPRYIPGTQPVTGFTGHGWAENTDEVPDARRISPPVADPADADDSSGRGQRRSHAVTIKASIDAGFRLEQVESASHPLRVRARPNSIYDVEPQAGAVQADSDFVLRWRPIVGKAPSAALFREEVDGQHYVLLMVVPPRPEDAERARLSRETIIVVDTSGSMAGESIEQARKAVHQALDKLRPEDAFNIIRFDSGLAHFYPFSQPATPRAVAEARAWVDRLQADGGTEMLPALRAALQPGPEGRAVRQVIFLTDGSVGNEAALFSTIQSRIGQSRLYPVGIGSAPNSHFMTKAAEFGRGTFTYIASPSEVAVKMNALFTKLDHPVLHDLRVDWGATKVEAWPARIPDVYVGEPVVIAARIGTESGPVTLRGKRASENVVVDLALGGGSHHEGVARLWARRKIASLMDSLHEGADVGRVSVEVAGLGVEHHLVTRWTSLVAVDVTPTAPPGLLPEPRAIPNLLPRGWDISKVFGPSSSEARSRQSGSGVLTPESKAAFDAAARSAATHSLASMQSPGTLPQGATPAALLVLIGSVLLGAAGLLWGLLRGGAAEHARLRS